MNNYDKFYKEIKGFEIPSPFFIKNNKLYRENGKKEEFEFISRQAPYITKYFDDVEENNVQYELKWFNDGKIYNDIIPAIALATKREVILLANKGLSSNDKNARFLIEYFDLFLEKNKLKRSLVVNHLGYVGEKFIHPLLESEYRIIPPDDGEMQKLNAIKCKGSIKEWIENVLEPLYDTPKALFPVISSFASVLFKEYDLKPILVDISSVSSSGKTTVQKASASVWGQPSKYINSMFTTIAGVERMAAFLSSFPLILDDTNTAHDLSALQHMIYLFGNGTGKMRASIEGSRVTSSWQSVLITTGENNILEYTKSQGGAARVIPITNFKFINKDRDYFASMNQNVEKFYGIIGLEFIKRWKQHSNRFNGRFEELAKKYQLSASNNDVMHRIALHYAFIIFVAEVINELFKEESILIPIDSLEKLFLQISYENNHVDRAKNILIEILEELEANRNTIYSHSIPPNSVHAIYNENGLFLTINFLKNKLKEDQSQIREVWKSKDLTQIQKQNGRIVDYKTITHRGESFRVVQINQTFIKQEGFDFSIKEIK